MIDIDNNSNINNSFHYNNDYNHNKYIFIYTSNNSLYVIFYEFPMLFFDFNSILYKICHNIFYDITHDIFYNFTVS